MSEEREIGGGSEEVSPEVAAAEAEARTFGWRPEEEFDGPPERWRSAQEFLAEGQRINGFLRKDMETLRKAVGNKDKEIAELRQTMREFAQYHEETEAKAYQRARDDLRAERKEALRQNDGERVVEVEDLLEQLETAKPTPRKAKEPEAPADDASQNEPDPVFVEWVGANKWFQENRALRALANDYGTALREAGSTLVGRAFLDTIKKQLQADFPEKFSNPARYEPSAGGPGGDSGNGRAGRGKTYADLPQEDRAVCDKFVKQGLVKSREAYVKDYFGA